MFECHSSLDDINDDPALITRPLQGKRIELVPTSTVRQEQAYERSFLLVVVRCDVVSRRLLLARLAGAERGTVSGALGENEGGDR